MAAEGWIVGGRGARSRGLAAVEGEGRTCKAWQSMSTLAI